MAYVKQNDLLLTKLLEFYTENNNMKKMISIITGDSRISLRIVDWFATNYAKKYYTVYEVYNDYKLNLKAYSKKRFDPFCRWERISIPYEKDVFIQTTIGQLNFFKWAIQNGIVTYIENNYAEIESDMNLRHSIKNKDKTNDSKTRKKREELSISATKSIKREEINITIEFK
jgi:hypothetical protein